MIFSSILSHIYLKLHKLMYINTLHIYIIHVAHIYTIPTYLKGSYATSADKAHYKNHRLRKFPVPGMRPLL